MMKQLTLLICALLLFALAACGTATTAEPTAAAATPKPTNTPRPSATPAPTATREPTNTPAPTAVPVATFTAELSATVVASLPPTPTPAEGGPGFEPGIEGVGALALQAPEKYGQLWAVWSRGTRAFDPPQNHFVAIYGREQSGWRELARTELADPDYLDAQGVAQVQLDPRYVWLEAQGGVGAHGGCYDLLRFDGQALHSEVSTCGVSPGVGHLADVNGDGTPDVVIDTSDAYVFCYACGVRKIDFRVQRWDGQKMQDVDLQPLPADAPAELRRLSDLAVAQANAGLWKDALATAGQLRGQAAGSPAAAWNAGLIELIGAGRAEQASSGAYPLLDHLFDGDYAAALDVLRPHPPAELFSADTPLVKGTMAEGWEQPLTDQITQTAGLLIDSPVPDLAPAKTLAAAHFLRGWALHLTAPASPAALTDVERAAQLDPAEPLYAASAEYLRAQR
jgi:hypothetical protein